MIRRWVDAAGLDPTAYGTHSMRRTKATLIYERKKNLRAVQLLLGHSKIESTIRYLGIEVDDALEISEQTEIQSLRRWPRETMRRPGSCGRISGAVLFAPNQANCCYSSILLSRHLNGRFTTEAGPTRYE
jgi:hypothetical protein